MISYVPVLGRYVDAGVVPQNLQAAPGQDSFRYDMGLNLANGEFRVIESSPLVSPVTATAQ